MKNFPKTIKTGQDIEHCFAMVQSGDLAVADLKCAIKCIEEQGFLKCPIVELSADRKKVTLRFCYEAAAGTAGNVTITNVKHEADPNEADKEAGFAYTVLTLQAALPEGEKEVKIPIADPFNAIGISRERINEIKEVLKI